MIYWNALIQFAKAVNIELEELFYPEQGTEECKQRWKAIAPFLMSKGFDDSDKIAESVVGFQHRKKATIKRVVKLFGIMLFYSFIETPDPEGTSSSVLDKLMRTLNR